MKKQLLLMFALVFLALPVAAPASTKRQPSPSLVQMAREVDPQRIERSIRTLAGFGTRHTLSSQTDPARGIGAARDWLYGELQRSAARSGGRMSVELQSYLQGPAERIPQPTTITNVVATLRGSQPESADRVYVVSGHYDSRCSDPLDAVCDAPGANDDASGVAAVLELARVMATRRFDATVVFMAVAGEEQGLFGSNFYAEQAKQAGVNIDGMFTNDIIGSSLGQNGQREPFSVRLFAEGTPIDETPEEAELRDVLSAENDSQARQLARYVKEVGQNRTTDMRVRIIARRDRFLRGGDHRPFLEQRYPAARFTEVNEDYRHQHQDVRVEDGVQYGDLARFVDFRYVARVTRVNLAALASLSRAPGRPSDVVIDARELSDDTTLFWSANPEPDLAGYEIVWRDTTEPLWTHSRFVGNVTSYTVEDITKDNFHFGVRAVDRAGNRSTVRFPGGVLEED
ncbi:MAG TPA: M28 family metallopeptidase [Thermoleophilaceae bacterium]|nr:M28 family metallopeptidase [Thermoleophilaceae bacterium]